MSWTLFQRLLATYLVLTLIVLLATLALARWSFNQGFLDYVNAVEQVRLQAIAGTLQEAYTIYGSWEAIPEQTLHRTFRENRPRSAGPSRERRLPPPRGRREPDRFERPRGFDPSSGPDRPRGPEGTGLYGIDGQRVFGGSVQGASDDVLTVPIILDGATIGEVRGRLVRDLTSPEQTEFARQQLTVSWILGALGVLLCVVLSYLLARSLSDPLRRLLLSVRNLEVGDYDAPDVAITSNTRELAELARGVTKLANTLGKSRTARQRWFASISHELRTPITVLSGELEALADGVRTLDVQAIGSLREEVARLQNLVDDLYQLSVADAGGLRYEFATLKFGDWLRDELTVLEHIAQNAGLELTHSITHNPTIRGDAARLQQLLRNLLENACKYTDAPGSIVVTTECSEKWISLIVEDSAPGVDASQLEALFEPLYRAEASGSRRTGGAGLGLAICANIVEAHDGRISATPSSLGGLRCTVQLPIVAPRDT